MELTNLYKNLIDELLHDLKDDWDYVEVNFEYFPWKGDNMEVHKSKFYKNNIKHEFTISLDVNDVFIDINNKMAEDGKERLTSCHFNLDSTGKYDFDFGYGMPPLIENMLRNAGEIE